MSTEHSAARERLAALPHDTRIAVVTGASSGIGEATARELARLGTVQRLLGIRAAGRTRGAVPRGGGGPALPLDVTDAESCAAFCAAVPRLHVLVNNAGGAKGTSTVMDADEDQWRWMWETNVLGTLRLVRGLMPVLVETGDGLVVTITSIAALESYDNGSGYTSAKHAQAVLHRTLRGEHLGQPVRFTEIAPGMVETEFSLVRFEGDDDKAGAVYRGLTPMVAQDIAEIVGFVASRPSHVNLDTIVVKPRDQHSAMRAHRR